MTTQSPPKQQRLINMYKKRDFVIQDIACKAVLNNRLLTVTIKIPNFTITNKTEFKPLTPIGIRLQTFEGDYPERVALKAVTQCRGFIDATTSTARGRA